MSDPSIKDALDAVNGTFTVAQLRAAKAKLDAAESEGPITIAWGNDEAVLRAVFGADSSLWHRLRFYWWKRKVRREFRRWIKLRVTGEPGSEGKEP